MPPRLRPDRETLGFMEAYGRYASFGLQLVVTMCLLGWGGWWLDGKLGTYPLLMILGLFAGAGCSFYALIKTLAVEPDRRRPPAEPPR
jgi:ATP synthase protein I